jgi:hypothetical protein
LSAYKLTKTKKSKPISLLNIYFMIKKFKAFNESNEPNSLLIPQEEVIRRLNDLNKRYQDGSLSIGRKAYLRRFNAIKNVNTISNQIKRFGSKVTRLKGYTGIYVYHGKNFTVQVMEDCCETCWWSVYLSEDGLDQRVYDHFYDYNQYDTKGEVLQAVLALDMDLSQ